MDFSIVFNQILILFILLVIGFISRKLNIVDEDFSKSLSNFLFNIIFPAMIIDAMSYPFSVDMLVDSGWLILISTIVLLISIGLSFFITYILNVNKFAKNVYMFALIFSNFAFMGFPVIEALFGKEGVFYAAIYNLPIFFLVNSFGIMLIKRRKDNGFSFSLKNVLNVPFITTIIGFLFFLFSIELPFVISSSVEMMAQMTTPLAMVLAGLVLANAGFKRIFSNYKVYIISIIRLIILPIIVLILLKSFKFDLIIVGIPVMITAMPVAVNLSVLTEKFYGDSYSAAQCVFISTLLSLFTIPIIAAFI